MKKITVVGLLIFLFCNVLAQQTIKQIKPSAIVGTWRLIEFADKDSATNVWIDRYGKNPRGYFTYTKNGLLNINISSDHPLKITEEEGRKYSVNLFNYIDKNSFGYFGTYAVEPDKGRVIHHVNGGCIPWYTDTDQPRQFKIKGDTIIIGDNIKTRRVLVRAD